MASAAVQADHRSSGRSGRDEERSIIDNFPSERLLSLLARESVDLIFPLSPVNLKFLFPSILEPAISSNDTL
jgi:hypothetical protein